jgi:hypothetical protein
MPTSPTGSLAAGAASEEVETKQDDARDHTDKDQVELVHQKYLH